MPELQLHEIEQLRRSVVMASSGQPCGLSRELVIDILEQLQEVMRQRNQLLAERSSRSNHPSGRGG